MTLDKQIIMQIFGSIMKEPGILSEVENYTLVPDDFETSFEKYIFMSIANLHREGAETISILDIDSYLAEKPHIHEIFNKYNGIEYLQDAMEMADTDNFSYYYNKLKKYNAIKDLQKLGFDTNIIYPEKDMLSEEDCKKREKFDELTITDIFNEVKGGLSEIESKYGCASAKSVKANFGIQELISKLQQSPEAGAPCQGDILNTITRGARKGKFYLLSAMSGGGKTRTMVGNACYIAYPIRYDSNLQKWVNMGSCEKVLYIGSEQVYEEIQTLILAYLTDINEEVILSGIYTDEQQDRINKAIEIMKLYEDNFVISQIPEPNLTEVRSHLRTKCLREGCEYVFYDYIFVTPSLLGEFRDLSIRQDVALRLLSTLLKDLAVELDVFIMSATQITGQPEFNKGYIRNYMLLRDSKSIPDKADFACIKSSVLPEEINLLQDLINITGIKPTHVTDVYKIRRGRWNNVRIWSKVDNGTCRNKDLFVTDGDLNIIQDFRVKNLVIDYEDEELIKTIDKLNENLISSENYEEREESHVEEAIVSPENWDSMF